MRHLFAVLFVALALAAPLGFAAEKASSTTAASGKYSMAPNGRFHRIHKKQADTDCKDCHRKDAPDLLVVSSGAPLPKDSP
ncbi:MAG TPA: hypothetical protein VLC55_07680, partial [Burkholderiales bacterium]|nr:hypothetical protein [Burkholderiales bacterium]